jgi:hypothetical protein
LSQSKSLDAFINQRTSVFRILSLNAYNKIKSSFGRNEASSYISLLEKLFYNQEIYKVSEIGIPKLYDRGLLYIDEKGYLKTLSSPASNALIGLWMEKGKIPALRQFNNPSLVINLFLLQ